MMDCGDQADAVNLLLLLFRQRNYTDNELVEHKVRCSAGPRLQVLNAP
jgi:hypothetical protein